MTVRSLQLMSIQLRIITCLRGRVFNSQFEEGKLHMNSLYLVRSSIIYVLIHMIPTQ